MTETKKAIRQVCPEPHELVTVNAAALYAVLCALQRGGHHVRELQVLNDGALAALSGKGAYNPIGKLIEDFQKRSDKTIPVDSALSVHISPELMQKAEALYLGEEGWMENGGRKWDALGPNVILHWCLKADSRNLNTTLEATTSHPKEPEQTPVPARPMPDAVQPLFEDSQIEQRAFEQYAKDKKLDMGMHPLHYIFMDHVTDTARHAWKAGLAHGIERMKEALGPMPPEVKRIGNHWVDKSFGSISKYEGVINIEVLKRAKELPDGTHRLYLHPHTTVQLIAPNT